MTDEQLETIIAALVKRKDALDVDSAEYRFINRCLNGLRYSYEMAGPIWEDLDPWDGALLRPDRVLIMSNLSCDAATQC
jgi:hypothetical protein